MVIESFTDLRGYFHERLRAALHRSALGASEGTEHYLLELLSSSGAQLATPDRPLVDRLQAALAAPDPRDRLRSFRETGDAALYTCGFFPDHLDRRGMSPEYFATVGAAPTGPPARSTRAKERPSRSWPTASSGSRRCSRRSAKRRCSAPRRTS